MKKTDLKFRLILLLIFIVLLVTFVIVVYLFLFEIHPSDEIFFTWGIIFIILLAVSGGFLIHYNWEAYEKRKSKNRF